MRLPLRGLALFMVVSRPDGLRKTTARKGRVVGILQSKLRWIYIDAHRPSQNCQESKTMHQIKTHNAWESGRIRLAKRFVC